MSVRTRLVGGFLAMAALIAIIGLSGLAGLAKVGAAYDEGVRQYATQAKVALELQVAILNQVRAQKNYLLRGEAGYLEEVRQLSRRVADTRERLRTQRLDPAARAILQQAEAEIDDLDAAFEASARMRDQDGIVVADRLVRGKAAAIVRALDGLVARAEKRAEQAQAMARAQAVRTRHVTIVLIALVAVLAIGLGIALSLSITRPLQRLQAQMRAIADEGVTPSEPAIKGKGELAQIAAAFHDMVQRASLLREMEARSKRLAALSTRVARAQEEERERIARELHDGLAQALTAIKLDLSAARRALSGESEGVAEHLLKAQRLTEESLDELRGMVFDLRPPALDHLGLVAALESYARDFTRRFGVAVNVSANGVRSRLPFEVETALYRICQEALANISKHAEAGRAEIELKRTRDAVALTIRDDGKGFDAAAMSDPGGALKGIGILSMERRAEDLGGEFRVASGPGEGTTVRVTVPLSRERPA